MNLFKQILIEKNEAEEVAKIRQGIESLKKTQQSIDAMPDNKVKIDLQKKLNGAIKQLSDREKKLTLKNTQTQSDVEAASPQQTQGQQKMTVPPPQEEGPTPSAIAVPPQENKQTVISQTQGQQQKMTVPPPQEEGPTPSAIATPPQTPSDEEAKLMKTLHGSFNPKSKIDIGKLEQMRAARQEVGDKADLKTLSKAVYAKQYAKPPAAQAPAQQAAPQAANQQAAPTQQPLNVGNVQIANPNAAAQTSKPNVDVQIPQNLQFNPSATPQAPAQTITKQAPTASSTTQTSKPKVDVNIPKNLQFNPEKTEEGEENEEGSKKFKYFGLNKTTVQEKNNISKFLRHLSEKNYSSAHKYLKAIVENKVRRNILNKIDKI